MNKRFAVVLAARSGSSRLPGKAMLPILGIPMLALIIRRLRPSRLAERIILATSTLPGDDALAGLARSEGIEVFRGDLDDVVSRYVHAAAAHGLDHVVRVTGDCPFVDARTLDCCLEQCLELAPFDVATTKGAFPAGIDFEVIDSGSLARCHREEPLTPEDREHLTKFFLDRPDRYALRRLASPFAWDRRDLAFTVDTPADYAFCSDLARRLGDPLAPVERILEEARRA